MPVVVLVAAEPGIEPWFRPVAGAKADASARPHMAQYPPSMVPAQPGRVHRAAVVVTAAASPHLASGSPADSAPPQLPRLPDHRAPSTADHGPADGAWLVRCPRRLRAE